MIRGFSRRRTCAPRRPPSAGGSRRRAGSLRRRSRGPSCPPGGRLPRQRPAWPSCRSRTRSRYQRSPRKPVSRRHYSYSLPSCSARRSAVRFIFYSPNHRSLADGLAGQRRGRAISGPPRRARWRRRSGAVLGAEGRLQALAQQLEARQLAGRWSLIAPSHDSLLVEDHQRPLGEAAGMEHAEGRARGALRLEVRELLAGDAELLLEGALRPGRVTRNPVERAVLLGQLRQQPLVQLQLVCAHRAERERVEDEHGLLAAEILLGEALAGGAG